MCVCVCAPNVPLNRGNLCLFIPLLALLFLCGSQRDLSHFLIGINTFSCRWPPEPEHIILISPMLDLAGEIRAQRSGRFPEPCPNIPKNVGSKPVNLGSLPSTLAGGQTAKAAQTDSARASLRSSHCYQTFNPEDGAGERVVFIASKPICPGAEGEAKLKLHSTC